MPTIFSKNELAMAIIDLLKGYDSTGSSKLKTVAVVRRLEKAYPEDIQEASHYNVIREVLRELVGKDYISRKVLSKTDHRWGYNPLSMLMNESPLGRDGERSFTSTVTRRKATATASTYDTPKPYDPFPQLNDGWEEQEQPRNEEDQKRWETDGKFDKYYREQIELAVKQDRIAIDQEALANELIDLKKALEESRSEIVKLKEVAESKPRVIEIKRYDKPTVKLGKQTVPSYFQEMIDLISCRTNILLVGPAGCGKTTVARIAAEVLKLDFFPMSMNEEIGKAELIGTQRHNITKGTSTFMPSPFLTAFEEGGVALLDELDAANPNAMLMLNTALDNGYVSTPLRGERKGTASKHEDFICIGTANTFGKGADRMYVGRNQLDEATLDRFRIGIIQCDYDRILESTICPDSNLLHIIWAIRENVQNQNMRRIVSTRFIRDAYKLLNFGWDVKKIVDCLFAGWRAEEISIAMHNVVLS